MTLNVREKAKKIETWAFLLKAVGNRQGEGTRELSKAKYYICSPNDNCQVKKYRTTVAYFCFPCSWIMLNPSNAVPGSQPGGFCVSLSGGGISKSGTSLLPSCFLSWMSIFSFISVLSGVKFFFHTEEKCHRMVSQRFSSFSGFLREELFSSKFPSKKIRNQSQTPYRESSGDYGWTSIFFNEVDGNYLSFFSETEIST